MDVISPHICNYFNWNSSTCLLLRSIDQYHFGKSAGTSGSIYRKRISFISRFGAIVTFCQRGHFFTHPVYIYIYNIYIYICGGKGE